MDCRGPYSGRLLCHRISYGEGVVSLTGARVVTHTVCVETLFRVASSCEDFTRTEF